MAEFKIVISDPKTGKSYQKEVKDDAAKGFMHQNLKAHVKGELIDMTGYEFEITGGSDFCGFPMRADVTGPVRKNILAHKGVGIKKGRKGMLQRKTVCGNQIHGKIAQVNLKIIKVGKEPLEKIFGAAAPEGEAPAEGGVPKEEAKAEAPKAEKPAEEKKEEPPKEEKKEAPKEEKKEPAEEKPKEEKPAEEKKE